MTTSNRRSSREQQRPRSRRCLGCNHTGHVLRDCPYRRGRGPESRSCFMCGQIGHIARDCRRSRGGDQGAPPSGSPQYTSVVTVAAIQPNVAVLWRRIGGVVVEVMLDFGSTDSAENAEQNTRDHQDSSRSHILTTGDGLRESTTNAGSHQSSSYTR